MHIITSEEWEIERRRQREADVARFTAGKLRISWSQTRGGYALFVSGRMEGQLFDAEKEALEYLADLGIIHTTK